MPTPLSFTDVPLSHSVVVTDTCVLLNVLGYDDNASAAGKQTHDECINLLSDIQIASGTIAYTALAYGEVYNALLRGKLEELVGLKTVQESSIKEIESVYNKEYKIAVSYALTETKAAFETINSLPYVFSEPLSMDTYELESKALEMQQKYNMPGLTDLKHLIIADNEKAPYFATIDKDFMRITEENVTVITTTKNIKKYQ